MTVLTPAHESGRAAKAFANRRRPKRLSPVQAQTFRRKPHVADREARIRRHAVAEAGVNADRREQVEAVCAEALERVGDERALSWRTPAGATASCAGTWTGCSQSTPVPAASSRRRPGGSFAASTAQRRPSNRSLPAPGWGRTRSTRSSVPGEWARSIEAGTVGLDGRWRSKSCRRRSPPIPSAGAGSSRRRERSPPSAIPTSARSTTWVRQPGRRAGSRSTSWSWSTSRARRLPSALRRERYPSPRRCRSARRWRARWRPPTGKASSIATSSRET